MHPPFPPAASLFGFAATTFVLSLYNVQARGITAPNAVIGLAVGYGGLAQFVAGVWEFAAGNTYVCTAREGDALRLTIRFPPPLQVWCHGLLLVRRLLVVVCDSLHSLVRHQECLR